MKLANFVTDGQTRVGIVRGGSIFDLAESAGDIGIPSLAEVSTVDRLLEKGLLNSVREREGRLGGATGLPLESVKLRSPILSPEKIFCLAENYRAHKKEAGGRPTEKPYLFTKFRNTIIGPGDPILVPRVSEKVDWEAELAVIIGRDGKYIPRERAMDYVAGYTVSNDVSYRDLQFPEGWPERLSRLGQNWVEGKGLDNAFPMGPWLATTDEVPDPYSLRLSLTVNGERKQDSSTGDMIFKIDSVIEHISAGITLRAGDVISTGTGPGVAVFTDQRFLKQGDLVEAAIDKIGVLRNPVQAEG
ncbi:MAG TPA: fumarylacetoacetate hydrolase family protein [Nitrososphaerales archaeon]|nr:fumarylacetoacetate hydrolase family protein [Nitrososphaerales archaeon]